MLLKVAEVVVKVPLAEVSGEAVTPVTAARNRLPTRARAMSRRVMAGSFRYRTLGSEERMVPRVRGWSTPISTGFGRTTASSARREQDAVELVDRPEKLPGGPGDACHGLKRS